MAKRLFGEVATVFPALADAKEDKNEALRKAPVKAVSEPVEEYAFTIHENGQVPFLNGGDDSGSISF